MAYAGLVEISSVKCESVSHGIAPEVIVALTGVGAVAGVVAIGATASVVGVPVGVAAGCTVLVSGLVLGGMYFIAYAIPDNVYIKLNGNKVWPQGSYKNMHSGATEQINYSGSIGRYAQIEIWDHDTASMDDLLWGIKVDLSKFAVGQKIPVPAQQQTNSTEGSIYAVEYVVTRLADSPTAEATVAEDHGDSDEVPYIWTAPEAPPVKDSSPFSFFNHLDQNSLTNRLQSGPSLKIVAIVPGFSPEAAENVLAATTDFNSFGIVTADCAVVDDSGTSLFVSAGAAILFWKNPVWQDSIACANPVIDLYQRQV